MEKSKGGVKKAVSKALGIALTAVTVLLMAAVIYIMVCNMQGKTASFFGTGIMKVVTGSMEPSIHEGDYIIVKKTDTDALKEGDIICFYSQDSDIYGRPNTHRIIEIADDGSFVTKGDANQSADEQTVSPDSVIGRYEGKSRLLRWINSFADGKKLLMLLVIIPMTAMAVYEALTVARLGAQCAAEKQEKLAQEKERLFREAVEREKQRLAEEGLPEDKTAVRDDTDTK